MDTVWAGVIVTDRTVNVNITRLRKKLGPYAQNIASRTGYGYVFEEYGLIHVSFLHRPSSGPREWRLNQ